MSEIEKFEKLHTKVLSFVTEQFLEGENTIESYYKLIEVSEASNEVDYPNNHNVHVKEQYIDDTIVIILLRIEIMFKEVNLLIKYNNSLITEKLGSISEQMQENNTVQEKLTTQSPESVLIKMIDEGQLLEKDIVRTTMSLTNIEDGYVKTVIDFKPTMSTIKKILQVQHDNVTGDTNELIENTVVICDRDIILGHKSSYISFISLYNNFDCQIVLMDVITNETYISDNVFRIEKLICVKEV